ncbi:MAG: hypothetical protein WC830_02830 [Burkholderiales bacterium]|jgi:hypothetical protein
MRNGIRGGVSVVCGEPLVPGGACENHLEGMCQAVCAGLDMRLGAANEIGNALTVMHVGIYAQALALAQVQIVQAARNS